MTTNNKPTSEAIARMTNKISHRISSNELAKALLNKLSLLTSNKQQLINKHEASLRALRLVQSDRQQINNNKGSK